MREAGGSVLVVLLLKGREPLKCFCTSHTCSGLQLTVLKNKLGLFWASLPHVRHFLAALHGICSAHVGESAHGLVSNLGRFQNDGSPFGFLNNRPKVGSPKQDTPPSCSLQDGLWRCSEKRIGHPARKLQMPLVTHV